MTLCVGLMARHGCLSHKLGKGISRLNYFCKKRLIRNKDFCSLTCWECLSLNEKLSKECFGRHKALSKNYELGLDGKSCL